MANEELEGKDASKTISELCMETQSQAKRPQHHSVATGVFNFQEGFITCLLLAAAKVAQDEGKKNAGNILFSTDHDCFSPLYTLKYIN